MSFLVATNVVASRPPERRPTGTPHARANWLQSSTLSYVSIGSKEQKCTNPNPAKSESNLN